MSAKRKGPPPRNVETADGVVRYQDSGWSPEEWKAIRAALARARGLRGTTRTSSGNAMRQMTMDG